MSNGISPFKIAVPESELDDLRARLRRTRWPERETVDDWSQGVPLAYLQDLCGYWAEGYDWRASEERLNRLPQFRTEIDGLGIHFIHARSPRADALPLIITHGWPGSVVEFDKVVETLTEDFHVVCPSLPGYGFSDKPVRAGWGVEHIARAWAELMARLGYHRYGAQGGDWGAMVTLALGQQDPDHVAGIHLNMPIAAPGQGDDLTADEQAALAAYGEHQRWGTGYSKQQSTRPQTLGYGLVDSAVGQCAWIVEKFRAWTDPRSVITRDELLDNVMLYWLPAAGASSARLYWESLRRRIDDAVTVPSGCSVFPCEIMRPSRRWVERRFTDLRYWNELDRGGHFAAFEQPDLFVNELRSFFALVR
jgi:pimeloyl-ACP methyl ester carboxylesterase